MLSYFKPQKLWSEESLNTNYLVTWTVLYFQFHTHQTCQHSKASHYFQTVAELHLSVHKLCPPKPHSFDQIKTNTSVHVQIFTTWRYTFGNWGFTQHTRCEFNQIRIFFKNQSKLFDPASKVTGRVMNRKALYAMFNIHHIYDVRKLNS